MSDKKEDGKKENKEVEQGNEQTPSQKGQLFHIPPEKDFYVDWFEVRGCLYDFQVLMGKRISGRTEKEPESVNFAAVIRMAPQHLKDFIFIMLEQIQRYEAKFGEIPSQFTPHTISFTRKPQFVDAPTQEKLGEPPKGSSNGPLSC